MKEYNHPDGYVRETILIFTDPDLEEEKFLMMKKKLSGYTGNHGEVIKIEIVNNEDGPGAIIIVVIICFKSLLRLLKVTNRDYSRFITNHRQKIQKLYNHLLLFDPFSKDNPPSKNFYPLMILKVIFLFLVFLQG